MNDIIEQRQRQAQECHQRAMRYAGMAVEAFLDYAAELRTININRYYEELGFQDFGSYLRRYYDISDKQAYKYIAVYEERDRLPGELFSPGRKIEISKLYLLTTVPEEQRAEVISAVDMDTVSKAQLEKTIAELKAENKRLEQEKQVSFEELEKLKNKPDSSQAAKERIEFLQSKLTQQEELTQQESRQREAAAQRASIAETDREELKAKVSQLQGKLRDLESREPEPVKDDLDEFRAYFAAAVDAVKRVTMYVDSHKSSKHAGLFKEKLEAMAGMIRPVSK